jgi:hypothetical protein
MKRWIADYRVDSEIILLPKDKKLIYTHPENLFEIHISNTQKSDNEDEVLSFQIIVSALDIQSAEKIVESNFEKFLHLLSFITNTKYKIIRQLHITDWSPGISERESLMYTKKAKDKKAAEALSLPLLDTAKTLHTWGTTPALERALRWFASGVKSNILEDQFQFFWFVVELIAGSTKTTEVVTDKCQKCSGDLRCTSCNEISTHRPFPKQKIQTLLQKIKIDSSLIDNLFLARNSLMHGETRETIEKEIQKKDSDFRFHQIVDQIGKAAWLSILISFDRTKGPEQPGMFLQTSTYVDWSISAKAHMIIGVAGDANNPQIEDIRLPQMSVVFSEQGKF